jgi:hypothetical protein
MVDDLKAISDWGLAACDQEIARIHSLLNLPHDQEERKRLVSRMVKVVDRRVAVGLDQTINSDALWNQEGPPERDSDSGAKEFGDDFRLLFNQTYLADSENHARLADGDRITRLLEPMVAGLLTAFDPRSSKPREGQYLQTTARRIVFFGLRTHCVCFKSPYRFRNNNFTSLRELYDDWCHKAVVTHALLRDYDEGNHGIPKRLFKTTVDAEIEPALKSLGQSWWLRMKNRGRFQHLFATGILLGMLYDQKCMKTS